MCIRYMPKDSLEREVTRAGAFSCRMQEKTRKRPKVARRTLGVQNSQDHSTIGVEMASPGMAFIQKDQPVKMAPTMKLNHPTVSFLLRDQSRW